MLGWEGKGGKPLVFVENLQVFVEKGRELGGWFLDHAGMCKAMDVGRIPGRKRGEAAG